MINSADTSNHLEWLMSLTNNPRIGQRVRIGPDCALWEHRGKCGTITGYFSEFAVTVKLDSGSSRPDGTVTVFEKSLEPLEEL